MLFLQRQKIVRAATLKRSFAVGCVGEEILQRGQQERPELALPLIGARVDLVLDQVSEKALRKVLRIFHGVPATAHESVKRRPIGLAKLSERRLGKLRVSLASSGCDNHAPMGRSEGIALTMGGAPQLLHLPGVTEP